MNPFLLAFAGALAALLLVVVLVYTYAVIKIRPMFVRLAEAGLFTGADAKEAISQGARSGVIVGIIDDAMRTGQRVVVLPRPEDLRSGSVCSPSEQTRRDRETEIVAVLNGERVLFDRCPMCDATFDDEPAQAAPVAPDAA